MAFKPAGGTVYIVIEDLVRLVGPLGVMLLWRPRMATERRPGPSWTVPMLGLSVGAFAAGSAVSLIYVVQGRAVPIPSPADLAFLGSYLFLLAAILLLPSRTLSVTSRTRALLDTLLIVVVVGALAWYFILAPDVLRLHDSTPAKIVNASYPAADVVLMCCLLVLAGLTRDPTFRRAATMLGIALIGLIAADGVREYQIVHGVLQAGTLLDAVRPLAYMLLGLVAGIIADGSAGAATEPDAVNPLLPPGRRSVPQIWRYLLPYCSVPAVVALMIYIARTSGDPHRALPVYVAGALLIELVLLHQFLDYRELIGFASRNARLESLAANDPVTGVPNHRSVVTTLDGEIARARRYGRACALLFLDLDHFKALNDSYGHPSGDAALREFASVVRAALREPDSLGRWGGEEFVAVLPETDDEAAMVVAERVRAAVATHTFWAAGGAHLTCSIGVAAYPGNAGSRDALIERADQAMYAAKRLGRNQVRSAGDPAVAALDTGSGQHGSREESALSGTIEALAALVEARDPQTGQHLRGVSALAARLALELGLDTSEAHRAGMAGRLQDIGNVAIPDGIVIRPEPLSEEEWAQVRRHPAVGAAVISRIPRLGMLAAVVRAHHERWDGRGYPDGLQGESIPLEARILAVADAFEAMVAGRPYRPAISPAAALAEIERCAGSQFDPEIVEALRRLLRVSVGRVVA
jgi:diguanylate cyclase (GGDEF)-like protein